MSWEPVDAASGSRRQRIVLHVRETESPLTVDELVDELDDPGPGSWEEIHRELTEYDLPALDQAGVIQFDADSGLVTDVGVDLNEEMISTVVDASPTADGTASERDAPPTRADVAPSDGTDDWSPRWPVYYAALTVVGVVATLSSVYAGPLASVPPLFVTGAVIAAMFFLSGAHLLAE